MPCASYSLRPLSRPGCVQARVHLGGTYLQASGSREVIEQLLAALEDATGEALPPVHMAQQPMAGQTEIYDVPGV